MGNLGKGRCGLFSEGIQIKLVYIVLKVNVICVDIVRKY